jgi:hypothetical protein
VGGTSTVPPAARKCDWIFAVVSTEGQTAALTIEPARPWPFSLWSKVVIRFPVVMSWASRFARATRPGLLTGVPAGRALAKLPVTYTVLPTTTSAQATPSICTVGNGSALTVAGSPDGGDVSAATCGENASASEITPVAELMTEVITAGVRSRRSRRRSELMNPPGVTRDMPG